MYLEPLHDTDFIIASHSRTNMEDLIETTHRRHYELYRKLKLEEKGFDDKQDRFSPFFCLSWYFLKQLIYYLNSLCLK